MFSGCSQSMWAHFSLNLVLSGPLFSLNVVRKSRMLSGRSVYVLSSPQLELYPVARSRRSGAWVKVKCFAGPKHYTRVPGAISPSEGHGVDFFDQSSNDSKSTKRSGPKDDEWSAALIGYAA
jgi:hypothetical protein